MSEEQIAEQLNAEPVAEQPEAPIEEQPEDSNSNKALWAQIAPELADSFEELSTEAREGILLRKLAQTADAKATTEDGTAGPTDGKTDTQTPVVEIPNLDREALISNLKTAVDANDGESAVKMIDKVFEWSDATMRVVGGAQREMLEEMQRMREEFRGVTEPAKFSQAVARVPGAKETDIPKAKEYLKNGDAKTFDAALKLAVFDRNQAVAQGKKPSESAQRRAGAVAASRASGGNRSIGSAVTRVPQNMNEMRALMEAEEAAS
jgi:hypothetical protein